MNIHSFLFFSIFLTNYIVNLLDDYFPYQIVQPQHVDQSLKDFLRDTLQLTDSDKLTRVLKCLNTVYLCDVGSWNDYGVLNIFLIVFPKCF